MFVINVFNAFINERFANCYRLSFIYNPGFKRYLSVYSTPGGFSSDTRMTYIFVIRGFHVTTIKMFIVVQ